VKLACKALIAVVALALASAGCTTIVRSSAPAAGGASGTSVPLLGQTVSDDGRFTAFTSDGPIVAADTNGARDVYRRDNRTDRTTRVSLRDDGAQIPGDSQGLSVSGNGDHVAFRTDVSLEVADTNGTTDVYVRTISTGTTERVSIQPDGSPVFDNVTPTSLRRVTLSDDGRYALVDISQPGFGREYLRDLTANTTTLLSELTAAGLLTGNGQWMVRNHLCTGGPCVFEASFVSVDLATREPIAPDCGFEAYDASSDGRWVVGRRFGVYPTFQCNTAPTGLVRYDRSNKTLQAVGLESTNAAGITISNNGRFVAVLGDDGILRVADLQTGATQVADRDDQGGRGSTATSQGSISGNGRYVVIGTTAKLTADDDGRPDTFTRYAIEPSVTSAAPTSVARGASHVTVRLNGTELLPAPTVTFPGGGVTVHSVTVVNPGRVDVDLSVDAEAPTGVTNVLFTNTGAIGGAHSLCACLTIT
jgi:hypothetical protein